MKSKFLFLFLVLSLFLSSCENDSITITDNFTIEDALSKRLMSYGYKIDGKLIETFTNKDGITAITYLLEPNLWYSTYSNGKTLSKAEFLVKMTNLNEACKYELKTMGNELLGYYIVKDGSVVESAGYNTLETRGWWSNFKGCVKRQLDIMSSGSGAGTALALVCIAFGPECSAAIATYCAGESLF
jgi:hypothetical protein